MEKAIYEFQIEGEPIECKVLGNGHINDTFKVTTDKKKQYVLQQINIYVFKKPVELMENVVAVTEHIRDKINDPRRTLHFLPAKDGKFYFEEDGKFWRCYEFVDGFCLSKPETDDDLYEGAVAFGNFEQWLADFPAETLHETIPDFHDTPKRYQAFKKAFHDDVCGRAKEVQEEYDFAIAREKEAGKIQEMLDAGKIPLCVTHNDTKFDNVLLDKETRRALCVLDLDTVMPGTRLMDYGDSIRSGAATAAEDASQGVALDLHAFEVYTKGYLNTCTSLTEAEIDLLPLSVKTITLELAIRFLTDYLEGDKYFKIDYPEHNLVRARTQFELAADMEKKYQQMQEIVAKCRRDK